MAQGYEALTEKQKQTLRLLLDGHDAKSMARHLGLSVHTVNERLREARRKLSAANSKEAARLLRRIESPQSVGDTPLGDAAAPSPQDTGRPANRPLPDRRAAWVTGVLVMISIAAAILALSVPIPVREPQPDARPPAATPAPLAESEMSRAARDWLVLGDRGEWAQGWAATAASFRALNTVEAWTAAAQKVRVPLGAVVSRTLVDERDVPAPPDGYRMVRFRTDFANRRGATETLSLNREDGAWKVVGIYVE